jgi:hypothetical protein
MQVVVRAYLGVQPNCETECPDCFQKDQPMHHIIRHDWTGVISRHNNLVAEMAECAKEAGHHYVRVEQLIRDDPDEARQLRADIQLNHLYMNVTTDLDVTVVDPQTTTSLRRGSDKQPQVAASDAAKRKIRKYKPDCDRLKHEFVPLPFESTGGFGTEVMRFLKHCQGKAGKDYTNLTRHHTTWSSSSFSRRWAQRLSVCLHRANARIFLRAPDLLHTKQRSAMAPAGGDVEVPH